MSRGHRPNIRLDPPPAWRARVVLAAFGVFAVVLCGRAFELQVLDREFLVEEGAKRHLRTLDVPAVRGAIRDRRGEPLALSAPTESVWAVPSAVLEAPDRIAPLARQLEMEPGELRQRLAGHRDRQFLYLRRQLNPAHAQQVMDLEVPGVFLQREYRRYYPAGEAAAQLVGLTNIDGRGQEGLELALDKVLHGSAGSRRVIKDRLGRVVEDLVEFTPPQAGEDIRLTVDLRLQYLAYRELKGAVAQQQAKAGVVVMLDPATGGVLAMASYPSFNPNSRGSIQAGGLRNRAVTDIFEPGSTIKPLLVARALEDGAYSADSVIDTEGGSYRVGRLRVRDFRDYGDVDLARLLTKSSNVGAAKMGLDMGAEAVWRTYRDFGLGEMTGVTFPGERYGVLRDFYQWGEIATATASYGYGVSVTALQLVRAYGALADDGRLHPLQLVTAKPGDAMRLDSQRAIGAGTARQVRQLLQGVITPEGTASQAAVPGYHVAGKTGTVRKVTADGYARDRHQALFVGMAPVDEPRLVTLVMIDEPQGDSHYGGAVAAPVFARIMRDALRMLRVPPDEPRLLTADAATEERS